MIGAVFVIFASLALSMILIRLCRSATAQSYGKNLSWLCLCAVVAMADVYVLCHTAAVFITRASANFSLGDSSGGDFILWPVIVAVCTAATGFAAGAISLRFAKSTEASASKHTAVPDGQTLFSRIQLVALSVAVIVSVVILTLLLDYILLHFFSFSASRKLILAGVGLEIAALVAVGIFQRKKLWKIKHMLLSAALPLLFAVWLGYYVLLTVFPAVTIELVLFCGGSGLFVMLPTVAVVALIMRLGLRKRSTDEEYWRETQKTTWTRNL